ncbi:hypothetical protein L0F63_006784 [Massospora cicadina]|nr:hypothetical protein L0F63_006784 [Massospora cicadina]
MKTFTALGFLALLIDSIVAEAPAVEDKKVAGADLNAASETQGAGNTLKAQGEEYGNYDSLGPRGFELGHVGRGRNFGEVWRHGTHEDEEAKHARDFAGVGGVGHEFDKFERHSGEFNAYGRHGGEFETFVPWGAPLGYVRPVVPHGHAVGYEIYRRSEMPYTLKRRDVGFDTSMILKPTPAVSEGLVVSGGLADMAVLVDTPVL